MSARSPVCIWSEPVLAYFGIFGPSEHDRFQDQMKTFHCNLRLTLFDRTNDTLPKDFPVVERLGAEETE